MTNNRSVNLEEPIQLLLTKQEQKELKNVLQISRNEDVNFGNWNIFLNDQRIFSKKVTLNK